MDFTVDNIRKLTLNKLLDNSNIQKEYDRIMNIIINAANKGSIEALVIIREKYSDPITKILMLNGFKVDNYIQSTGEYTSIKITWFNLEEA